MKNGNRRQHLMRLSSVFLISAFILAVAVLAAPFYSASATFSPNGGLQAAPSKAPANAHQIRTPLLGLKDVAGVPFRSLSPLLPLGPDTIATYTSPGCTV